MHLLVLFGLIASSLADLRTYGPPPEIAYSSGGGFSSGGGGFSSGGGGGGSFSSGGGFSSGGFGGDCGGGLIRHVDGSCVEPIVNRNFYLYAAPALQALASGPPPQLPKPRVDYNIVFVRTPEAALGLKPIVVPPPQQKTLVYVLTRNGQISQQLVEAPAVPLLSPEVYYVNYNEGENPQLIDGIDLQSALAQASSQQGQLISGGGSAGGFSGGVVGGGFSGSDGGFSSGFSSGSFDSGSSFSSGPSFSGGQPSQSYGTPSQSYGAP